MQLGWHPEDEKASVLLDRLEYEQKLEILRKWKVIDEEDYSIVRKFQRFRNKMFHGDEPTYYILMPDDEREAIAKNAHAAFQILANIAIGTRYPTKEEPIWPPKRPS